MMCGIGECPEDVVQEGHKYCVLHDDQHPDPIKGIEIIILVSGNHTTEGAVRITDPVVEALEIVVNPTSIEWRFKRS